MTKFFVLFVSMFFAVAVYAHEDSENPDHVHLDDEDAVEAFDEEETGVATGANAEILNALPFENGVFACPVLQEINEKFPRKAAVGIAMGFNAKWKAAWIGARTTYQRMESVTKGTDIEEDEDGKNKAKAEKAAEEAKSQTQEWRNFVMAYIYELFFDIGEMYVKKGKVEATCDHSSCGRNTLREIAKQATYEDGRTAEDIWDLAVQKKVIFAKPLKLAKLWQGADQLTATFGILASPSLFYKFYSQGDYHKKKK